jgi:hypothetical protein
MSKKALNLKQAWDIQETYNDQPHGRLQWKGTDVCMDVYCKCGYDFHIHGYFAYSVKCPSCKTVYMCNGHIELIEVSEISEYDAVLTEEGSYD